MQYDVLAHQDKQIGCPTEARTLDSRLKRAVLYPLSYRAAYDSTLWDSLLPELRDVYFPYYLPVFIRVVILSHRCIMYFLTVGSWSPQRDLNSQTPAWRAGGFIHFAYGAIPLITTINHFLTQLFDTVGWSLLPHLVHSSEADLFSLLEIPFNNFLRKCAANEKSYPFSRCTQVECQTLILCNSHNSPRFVCFPDLTYR